MSHTEAGTNNMTVATHLESMSPAVADQLRRADVKPPRRRRACTIRSYVLTVNDPVQEILPQSDARTAAYVQPFTNAIFIGHSKADAQAGASAAGSNAAAQIPATNTVPYPLPTGDAVWAAASTLPTTLSVVSYYDQAEPPPG